MILFGLEYPAALLFGLIRVEQNPFLGPANLRRPLLISTSERESWVYVCKKEKKSKVKRRQSPCWLHPSHQRSSRFLRTTTGWNLSLLPLLHQEQQQLKYKWVYCILFPPLIPQLSFSFPFQPPIVLLLQSLFSCESLKAGAKEIPSGALAMLHITKNRFSFFSFLSKQRINLEVQKSTNIICFLFIFPHSFLFCIEAWLCIYRVLCFLALEIISFSGVKLRWVGEGESYTILWIFISFLLHIHLISSPKWKVFISSRSRFCYEQRYLMQRQ